MQRENTLDPPESVPWETFQALMATAQSFQREAAAWRDEAELLASAIKSGNGPVALEGYEAFRDGMDAR